MKLINCLKSLALLLGVVVTIDMSAAQVGVYDARLKASQFLNDRSEGVLMASSQELRLVHVEKADSDPRLAVFLCL